MSGYASWNPATFYVQYDAVNYGGLVYVATVDNINIPPYPITTTWALLNPGGGGGGGGQVLSLAGDTISLSGGGGAVDVATATTVAATAQKTTAQTYDNALLFTEFNGLVKVGDLLVKNPSLNNGIELDGDNATVYIGNNLGTVDPNITMYSATSAANKATINFRNSVLGNPTSFINYDGAANNLKAYADNNIILNTTSQGATRGEAILGTYAPANETFLTIGGYSLTNSINATLKLGDFNGGSLGITQTNNAGATYREFGSFVNAHTFLADTGTGNKTLMTMNNTTNTSAVGTFQVGDSSNGITNPQINIKSDNGNTTSIQYDETTSILTMSNPNGSVNIEAPVTGSVLSLAKSGNATLASCDFGVNPDVFSIVSANNPSTINLFTNLDQVAGTQDGVELMTTMRYVNPITQKVICNTTTYDQIPTQTIACPIFLQSFDAPGTTINSSDPPTQDIPLSNNSFVWRFSGSGNSGSGYCQADFVEVEFNATLENVNDTCRWAVVLRDTSTGNQYLSSSPFGFNTSTASVNETYSTEPVKFSGTFYHQINIKALFDFSGSPIVDGTQVDVLFFGITDTGSHTIGKNNWWCKIRPVRPAT